MGSEFYKKSHQSFIALDRVSRRGRAATEQMGVLEEAQFAPMDVYETKSELVVKMDLPGMGSEDITVSIQEGGLLVEGVKKEVTGLNEKVNFLCMERKFGPVSRLVKLPPAIDTHNISCSYDKGVMTIRAPKLLDRRRSKRRIPIE